MSGREQMPCYRKRMEDVNVKGTENVLKVCEKNRIKCLVYTSTYNVVFGGQVIINGDESLPYFPLHQHVDYYSKTKSIAEQLVLASHADQMAGTSTCALRLAGVIGPGEARHLPRMIKAIQSGWMHFYYHDRHGGLVDFIGIDNVVQGHVKAAFQLLDGSTTVGGQAYFLSDGQPVNSFEYFRPLFRHFDRPAPAYRIPVAFMYVLVYLLQWLFRLLHRWVSLTPLLTPAELFKTAVTHHFRIDKARQHFDYRPTMPNNLSNVVRFLADQ